MSIRPSRLADFIIATIKQQVTRAGAVTAYREPLVSFADADDPQFTELRQVAEPTHMLPQDLLPGARSVVSFFVPFGRQIVRANSRRKDRVAREWAVAYVETNALIGRITAALIELLAERGVRAAAEPATDNFDPETLISRWSHKSVAVIAGLGSFGLHHMVITDAGCAGRFGSVVIDAALPVHRREVKERCLYYHDGSCVFCVSRCPIGALDEDQGIDKQRCWARCLEVARTLVQGPRKYADVGRAEVCGKCAMGPCALKNPVVDPARGQ